MKVYTKLFRASMKYTKTPYALMLLTLFGSIIPYTETWAVNQAVIFLLDTRNTELAQICKSTLETDPSAFRQQLSNYIYRVLVNDIINKSIPKLVKDYWTEKYYIGEIYDRVVRKIVQKEKENSSLWIRIKGSFSTDTAKELGERIAKKTFNDPRLQSALSGLMESVSRDVMNMIKGNLTSIQNSVVKNCIRAAFDDNDNVNPALLKLFAQILERGSKKGVQNLQPINVGGVYVPYKTGAGLILIVIRRRILHTLEKRLAQRMAARIAGQVAKRVVSRFIPVVGVFLTGWDIYDIASGNSLFNSLQEALTSWEVKGKLRLEIIKALKEEMAHEARSIANDISGILYLALKKTVEKAVKYNEILNRDPLLTQVFNNLLQQGKVDEAQKLLDLALYTERIGIYDRFEKLLIQPQKLEAILQLYPSFLPILNYTKSFKDVYLWYQLVDKDLKRFQKIVDLEVYKYLDPQKVDKEVVEYVLKFEDFKTLKQLLVNVSANDLKRLTIVQPYKLENFINSYGIKSLKCLTYYAKIKPKMLDRVIELVETDSKNIQYLCQPQVKKIIYLLCKP